MTSIRTILHPTAESRFYADKCGRPCLVEETGTLGPMVRSDEASVSFLRAALVSLWAHDCHGLLWWCAFDQHHLVHAPYDWHAYERELGLYRTDRTAKPVLAELGKFRRFLDGLPFRRLPPRRTEAVCILTHGQDTWGAAYAAFVLAKQAGFDLVFQHAEQPLRDAPLYLVPSIRGGGPVPLRLWLALQEKVQAGATLYLSHDDGMVSGFEALFGLRVESRTRRTGPARLRAAGLPGSPELALLSTFRLELRAAGAEVLAVEMDGNPALARFELGRGEAWFLSVALERMASESPGFFHDPGAEPWWRVYRAFAARAASTRILTRNEPRLGSTEHQLDDGRLAAVLVNYGAAPLRTTVSVAEGWQPVECLRGQPPRRTPTGLDVSLDGCGSCVILLGEMDSKRAHGAR